LAVTVTVNGKGPGRDRLFAAVAGRRFPAPVRVRNDGQQRVEVEFRLRPGAGAQIRIEQERFTIDPGASAETRLTAETPSQADSDTVLVDGRVEHSFSFTAVSLARESIFHGLGKA
jgi:hypothetical protein